MPDYPRSELRLIGLMIKDPSDPEELPVIMGGKADVKFECDKITATYNFGAFYDWGKVPFVDDPISYHPADLVNNPVTEILYRMPMGTQLP